MNNAARTSRRPLPPRILRLCAELGIELVSASSQSDYSSGREVSFAVKDNSPRAEEWIIVRRSSGEAFAAITHWETGRIEWGAQRITSRAGERYLQSAHIYRTARTLPELLREVAS